MDDFFINKEKMSQNTGILSNLLEDWRLQQICSLSPKSDLVVLDIGCGNATILKKLKNIRHYTGIDLLKDTIDQNKQRYVDYDWICGDVMNIDLKRDFYDSVVLSAFVEHLDYQTNIKLFNKLFWCLKSTGQIIATTPHPNAESVHRIGSKVGLFSREAEQEHKCFFDKYLIKKLAQDTNFQLKKYQTFQLGLNQIFVYEK